MVTGTAGKLGICDEAPANSGEYSCGYFLELELESIESADEFPDEPESEPGPVPVLRLVLTGAERFSLLSLEVALC